MNDIIEAEKQLMHSLESYAKDIGTDKLIEQLKIVTQQLSMHIVEKKINNYFDREYLSYITDKMGVSDMFASKVDSIMNSIVKDGMQIVFADESISDADRDLDILVPYFTASTRCEIVYSIGSKTFIDSIVSTYDSDKSIVNQFLCDFFRQNIKINNKVYSSIVDLFVSLSGSNYKTQILLNSNPMSSFMLMLLLTCQSSYYLSYLYPYKVLEHLRKTDSHTRYVITDTKNGFNTVNLFASDPISDIVADRKSEVGCIIESSYKIIDVETGIELYSIQAETIFTERSDRCLIKYTVMPYMQK